MLGVWPSSQIPGFERGTITEVVSTPRTTGREWGGRRWPKIWDLMVTRSGQNSLGDGVGGADNRNVSMGGGKRARRGGAAKMSNRRHWNNSDQLWVVIWFSLVLSARYSCSQKWNRGHWAMKTVSWVRSSRYWDNHGWTIRFRAHKSGR
jgi:hypothetical protein